MMNAYEKVAEVSEVPQGTTKIVKVGGVELFVANVEGSFYALAEQMHSSWRAVGKRQADW